MKKIPLTQGLFAIVDDEDFEYLNIFKWHLLKSKKKDTFYAIRNDKDCHYLMHREIMKVNKPYVIDHKNHNGLDNQKSNLLICNQRINALNRRTKNATGYPGVSKIYNNKYKSSAVISGVQTHLGVFDSPIDAYNAYLNRISEFLNVQIPQPGEQIELL